MRFAGSWLLAGLVACGGGSFSVADGGSDATSAQDGASDTSSAEAASEAGVEGGSGDAGSPPVPCGMGMVCPVCCLDMPPACEGNGSCNCNTELHCWRDQDCSVAAGGLLCCIKSQDDATCSSGHYVAKCAVTCAGATHMCDPNGPATQCVASTCTTDAGALTAVGLPTGGTYGVCK